MEGILKRKVEQKYGGEKIASLGNGSRQGYRIRFVVKGGMIKNCFRKQVGIGY